MNSFTKQDMIDFAWWLSNNMGRFSDDQKAHFEGNYLEMYLKIKNESKRI